MNKRVVLLTVLLVLLVISLCLVSYLVYLPYWRATYSAHSASYTQVANAVGTQAAEILATEVESIYSSTQSAAQTQTAMPTPTLIPTPVPTANICDAYLSDGDLLMFPYPALGYKSPLLIPEGADVELLGSLADRAWLKIRYAGQEGWVQSATLQTLTDCQPTQYDLAYLLGVSSPGTVVYLQDTFYEHKYVWYGIRGGAFQTKTTREGEGILEVVAEGYQLATPDLGQTQLLPAFQLLTNLTRTIFSHQSYVGLRVNRSLQDFIEVRISPSCQLFIYQNDNLLSSPYLDKNACSRTASLLINFSIDPQSQLQIGVNGYPPFSLQLPEPPQSTSLDSISLVVNSSKAVFDYILVVSYE